MNQVFVDAWYYLALFSKDDEAHEAVVRWSKEVKRPIVTTDFVLLEVGNVLKRGPARGWLIEIVRSLRGDPDATVVPASRELVDQGLRLFGQRADKEWSLTDCISFVVMREHGIAEVLTGDHHFEQAGFTILLK